MAIIVELAILLFFLLMLHREEGANGQSPIHALVTGSLGAWFWIGAVLVGMVFPLIINFFSALSHKEGGRAPSILSPILILIGGFILRVVIVYAGQVGLG